MESSFAPSGHKGVEHFEPRFMQLAYFGERFREGNIRYNETFSDRPSFQPARSFAFREDTLTETFLQGVTMPSLERASAAWQRYEREKTPRLNHPSFSFNVLLDSNLYVKVGKHSLRLSATNHTHDHVSFINHPHYFII